MLLQKRESIHQNPVKRDYVDVDVDAGASGMNYHAGAWQLANILH